MTAPDDQGRDDPNFDAGDLSTDNPAEDQAREDFDSNIGSEDHQFEVADAREQAGLEPESLPDEP